MKRQKFLIFSTITIIVVGIAAFFSQTQAPQTTVEKELLFPELSNKINDVARIEINNSEDRNVILQKMQDGQWTVESADNYPAKFDKIKDTVVSLSELKILAEKTDNPKRYPELGVEGPEYKDTSSLLLTLSNDTGAAIASLIVGKPRESNAGDSRPNLYVRLPDAKNALMVEGYLQLKTDNRDWYERNVINIPASHIQTVDIVKSTGAHLSINKDAQGDTDFKVVAGKTSSPSVLLNKLGTFLEDINVEGVHAVDSFEFPNEATKTSFKTFNGWLITVKNILIDDKAFAHFSFTTIATSNSPTNEKSADNSETISVEEESKLWNQFLGNWVYEIPEFKFETLDINVGQSPE
ncbi:MAG: hypothetical protein ACI9ZT_001937 [Gammaproteobacteria bacterium]